MKDKSVPRHKLVNTPIKQQGQKILRQLLFESHFWQEVTSTPDMLIHTTTSAVNTGRPQILKNFCANIYNFEVKNVQNLKKYPK